jgi:hypothetical protein
MVGRWGGVGDEKNYMDNFWWGGVGWETRKGVWKIVVRVFRPCRSEQNTQQI